MLRLVRPAAQLYKRIELGAHRLAPRLRIWTCQSFLLRGGIVAAVDVGNGLDEIVEILVGTLSMGSPSMRRVALSCT